MPWTDIWCFTCRHEIKQGLTGRYAHLDGADMDGCPCAEDGLECQP